MRKENVVDIEEWDEGRTIITCSYPARKYENDGKHLVLQGDELAPPFAKGIVKAMSSALSVMCKVDYPNQSISISHRYYIPSDKESNQKNWFIGIDVSGDDLTKEIRDRLKDAAWSFYEGTIEPNPQTEADFSALQTKRLHKNDFSENDTLIEAVDSFIAKNGGKTISGDITFSDNPYDDHLTPFRGSIKEAEEGDFIPTDKSGVGKVDGVSRSENTVNIFEEINGRTMNKPMPFKLEDGVSIEPFIIACLYTTRVSYTAKTKKKNSGKGTDAFISKVWEEEQPNPEDFKLEQE